MLLPRTNVAHPAINLVAQSWGRENIGKDDEIVLKYGWSITRTSCRGSVWPKKPERRSYALSLWTIGQVLLEEYGTWAENETGFVRARF